MKAKLWTLNKDGLYCDKRGYLIEKGRLLQMRDGLYEWPVHMCIKNWVDVHEFLVAFRDALDAFDLEYSVEIFEATMLRCLNDAMRHTVWNIVSEWMFADKVMFTVSELRAVREQVDRILCGSHEQEAA